MHTDIYKTLFTICLVLAASTHMSLAAEPPVFPWGCLPAASSGAVSSAIGYSTLPRAQHRAPGELPVQTLPAKPHYAYGWFGSDPQAHKNAQWGRHFGTSQNYIQWSRR